MNTFYKSKENGGQNVLEDIVSVIMFSTAQIYKKI